MLQRLLCCEPLQRLHYENFPDEVLCLGRNPLPDVGFVSVRPPPDGVHLVVLGPREGHVPENHNEDRHPHTPHVALRRVALIQHLRCNVGQGATTQRHLGVGVPNLAEPEVNELEMVAVRVVIEEVLQLDVTVNDAEAVDVVDCQQHLPGCVSTVLLRKALPLGHSFEELSTCHAFHNEAELILGLIDIHKAGDVRVVHAQEDLSFGLQLLPLFPWNAVQLEPLYSHLHARLLVLSQVHLAIVA
mmetsp:Transcript_4484/g.10551  ORF Transcript_4484/g.10551 Transcript_4484/m.10551 type:complete len:244 (-) Transcript_4484:265-996(-)